MFVCVAVRGAEHKVDSDLARSISQFCEDIPVSVDELFKVRTLLVPRIILYTSSLFVAIIFLVLLCTLYPSISMLPGIFNLI